MQFIIKNAIKQAIINYVLVFFEDKIFNEPIVLPPVTFQKVLEAA